MKLHLAWWRFSAARPPKKNSPPKKKSRNFALFWIHLPCKDHQTIIILGGFFAMQMYGSFGGVPSKQYIVWVDNIATPVFVFCIMVSQIMISDLQRCATSTLQPLSRRNGGYRYYFFTLYFLDLVVCFWDPDSTMVDETSMKKIIIWGSISGTDFEHLQQILVS